MLSIRKGLALVLVAAMAMAAGCSGTKSKEGDQGAPVRGEKERVKIAFWHGLTQEHGEALQAVVDKFNESQDEIHVEATYQGSYKDLDTKLMGAIQSNTAPSVAQLTDSMLTSYVGAKVVLPLDSYLSASEKADYAKGLLDATTFDGKLFGLPFNKSMIVQIYDPKLVTKVPTTWEEYRIESKRAGEASGKPGTSLEPNVYDFGTLFTQAGGVWLKDGKAAFNGEAGIQALTYLEELIKQGTAISLKSGEYKSNIFNEGRSQIVYTTSASFAYMKREGWVAAPLFKGPAGHAVPLSGANAVIVKGASAEQQQAAAKFILFLTGKEGTLIFTTHDTGYMPVRKSAIADSRWTDFVKANPEYEALSASIDHGVSQPNLASWAKIQKEISTAVEKVFLGKATPKAALDEAAAKADQFLAGK